MGAGMFDTVPIDTAAYALRSPKLNPAARLPNAAHTSRPWRIHQIAPDFRLEDVWQLPWRGDAGEFPHLVEKVTSVNLVADSPGPARALFVLREKLGGLLGWDSESSGVGARVASVADRLPRDLRETDPPKFGTIPATALYLTEDEFAAEVANKTVHGLLHIGRVPDSAGTATAQMAVLVKPNGTLGKLYMAAIKPARYLVVYPLLLRTWARAWQAPTS
jgi:hypothetical protein